MTQYNTGTVTVVSGTVTGAGTVFDATMQGKWLGFGDGVGSVISSYISPTQLQLADAGINRPAGTSYAIWQTQTPNLGLPLFSKQDADPTDGLNRTNQIVDQALAPATSSTYGTVKVTSSATDTTAGRTALTEHMYASNSVNYHAGNLNVNVFTVLIGDVLATAYINTFGEVAADLPINAFSPPQSISVTGTFRVVNITNNTVIATGKQPLFSSRSTERNAQVFIPSVTGATPNDVLEIVAEVNSSITVNP